MHTAAVIVAIVMTLLSQSLWAQNNVLDLRLVEFNDSGDRTYHNFMYARTLAHGKLMFEAFHLRIPPDDYKEFTAGIGYNVATVGDIQTYVFGHLSTASDAEYLQPAILSLDLDGRITGSLFLLHYIPLGTGGTNQWLVDPFEVQYSIGGPIAVGFSSYFWRPDGGASLFKKGVKVSYAHKYGAFELAVRHVNNDDSIDYQLRSIITF
jgi:hypothetical protein